MQVLDYQIEDIHNRSVRTLDVVLTTYWKRWMIKTNEERVSDREICASRRIEIYIYIYIYIYKGKVGDLVEGDRKAPLQ